MMARRGCVSGMDRLRMRNACEHGGGHPGGNIRERDGQGASGEPGLHFQGACPSMLGIETLQI
ncbi:hypothetical protein GCM10011390_10860 [Aureimonas endophytica]|uniref:Uncharacterized protein n=1 Tax=Aureimonas endophytica TaxID=2027858 RepID=A0A917E2M1_9HYPH|nr:hypothetical protein GCM10011390_10860 [Aureimonas endophytica]